MIQVKIDMNDEFDNIQMEMLLVLGQNNLMEFLYQGNMKEKKVEL
jgi:hypothetical protein